MFSKIRERLSAYTWDLAYGIYSDKIIKNGLDWDNLHFVKNPYKTKWFADPFILTEDSNTIQFLVEEFDSHVKKGRIARIVVDKRDDEVKECHIILELPTHLSFPAIYRVGGTIYVHPENSESGNSTLYRYDEIKDRLVDPLIVVESPLTDAIIDDDYNNGSYKMYATIRSQSSGPILEVYESTDIQSLFINTNRIDYGRLTARMAGHFINTPEGKIRPAQDCNYDYGEAVLFYKGSEVIGEFRPHGWRFGGLHTFNTNGNSFVIDLKKYDFAWLHFQIKRLKRLFNR